MAVTYTSTREAALIHGVKLCVHGRGGVGKTKLIDTLEAPIIISAESGILSLKDVDIPTMVIENFADMEECYNFITLSTEARQFAAVALDSISEIAEECLSGEMGISKDGRKAYGEMNDKVSTMIKKFRDLKGKHVYFSAKQGRVTDEVTNVTVYGPDMPGRQLVKNMPYYFDELFSMEIGRTPEGKDFRFLRTETNLMYEAKDRSGALDTFEPPDLGAIINKILAVVPAAPSVV